LPPVLLLTISVFLVGPVSRALANPGTPQGKTGGPQLSRNWSRVTSGNLTASGPVTDGVLREAVDGVQAFRTAFATLYPTLRLTSPVPLRIVVFPDQGALRRFNVRDAKGRTQALVGGYIQRDPDLNSIVLGGKDSELAFHELAHFLLSRNFRQLPEWLNEGLADFHSTFEADWKKGRSVIGRAPGTRVRSLRTFTWVPLGEIVSATDAEMDARWRRPQAIDMFYSESWAVVHYLMLGRKANAPGAFARFVGSVARGTEVPKALEAAFGIGLEQLDKEVRDYSRRLTFPAIAFDLPRTGEPGATVERMTEADARYLQGDLLVRVGAYDEAEEELTAALALDPDHVPSRIDIARIMTARGNRAEAIASLQAIAGPAASAGFTPAYYLASALSADGRCTEAVDFYDRALALDRQSTDAWLGLSLCNLALGRLALSEAAISALMQLESSGEWYYRRAYFALGLGNADAVAAIDAHRFIKTAGWQEHSIYVAFVAAIAHYRLHQPDEARKVLELARPAAAEIPWTTRIIDYLEGRVTADVFLSSARTNRERTEAHTYIGFKSALEGHDDEALVHFRWAVEQGEQSYLEVGMAQRELDRLEPH
jgi:tetratricopeptide (TPR) repeat protein